MFFNSLDIAAEPKNEEDGQIIFDHCGKPTKTFASSTTPSINHMESEGNKDIPTTCISSTGLIRD
jgi:hypothetical protein